MSSKDAMKEVDRFWPDGATVVAPKKYDVYYRAVERNGLVVIEKVYPAVGDTVPETVYMHAILDYAEADLLIAQIMAAMEQVKKMEKADG